MSTLPKENLNDEKLIRYRSLEPFVEYAQRNKLDISVCSAGAGLDDSTYGDPNFRCSWNQMNVFMEVFQEKYGWDTIDRVASGIVNIKGYKIIGYSLGLFADEYKLFQLLGSWFGPVNFPPVYQRSLTRNSSNDIILELGLRAEFSGGKIWFDVNKFMMSHMTKLIGRPRAEISMEHSERSTEYTIKTSGSKRPSLSASRLLGYMGYGKGALKAEMQVQYEETKRANESLQRSLKNINNINQALAAVKGRYDRALRGTSDGVWEWNITQQEMKVSDQWSLITGIDERHVTLNQWKNLIEQGGGGLVCHSIELCLKEGGGFDGRYEVKSFPGKTRWVRIRGSLLKEDGNEYIAGSVSDVTLQKEALEDISTLLNLSSEALCLVDVHSGEVVHVNSSMAELLHLNENTKKVNLVDFIISKEDRGFIFDTLHEEGRIWMGEQSWVNSQGGSVNVYVRAMPFVTASGHAILLNCYSITEKMAEQARLVQTDRLVSMGTMTATIGHEINNPLAYMRTNVDLLQDSLLELQEGELPLGLETALEDAQESVESVLEGIKSVATIVDDLRSFSRLRETQELKPVKPMKIVESSANMVMNELRKADSFQILAETDHWVCADESRVMQVLTNFLTNAVLAVEDQAEKKITARIQSDEENRVVFSVEDTGCGIPADKIESVFEPFYTKRASGKGTGLGLYICKSLVEAMGGSIWVESTLGVGTTFFAALPNANPQEDEATSTPIKVDTKNFALAARKVSVRLLCVEEDDELRVSLTRSYAKLFDVICVPTARAAMALLEADVPFDAVLCSLRLREDSGLVLHDAIIEALGDDAPHFVFSIEDLTNEEIRALRSRSPSTLSKPVRREAILHRVLTLQDRLDELELST